MGGLMKLIVDKEAGRALMDLCGIVAQTTGIQQLNLINSVLDNMEIEEEKTECEVEEVEPPF